MHDASREYAYHHGILSMMDHAALVSMLAKGESNNEAVRQLSTFKDLPDLPTAHESVLATPKSVSDIELLPHADVWRHLIHQEFSCLPQAGIFAPASAWQSVANVIDAKWVYTWNVDEYA